MSAWILIILNPWHRDRGGRGDRGKNQCFQFAPQYSEIVVLFRNRIKSVCPLISNVKTAEPIGSKLCVGAHMNPGKVYGCSKLQKFVSEFFYFCKILKMREKILLISWVFCFLFCFMYIVQGEDMLTDIVTIKSWNRNMGSYNPSVL